MRRPIHDMISLVVLPFQHSSQDPDMEFFTDGITEEIIFALAKIEQLKVISRTSSFHFKEYTASIQEIGQQLNVQVVLEGKVRISGHAIRVSAQLIQVEDDTYLWSETWDRQLDNLFDIQDEISLLIADKLREHLGHLEISDRLVESHTDNFKAYEQYLKGRFHFNKWNAEAMQVAIQSYESAVALDPRLVDAHVGIADAYSFMAVAGFAPRESAWAKANAAMDTAKVLDAQHAGLNYMLANQAFFTEADYDKARTLALTSLANAPTFEEAQRLMSFLYTLRGDFKQAQQHLFYAKSIDPLNPETSFYEAFYAYRTGDYALATSLLDNLLAVNKMNLPALIVSIYVKMDQQQWHEAQEQLTRAAKAQITPDERLGLQCLIEIGKGNQRPDELTALVEHANDPGAHHAHSYLFMSYAMMGELTKALATLQHLFEDRSSVLLISFSSPLCERIKAAAWYSAYHARIYPVPQADTTSQLSNPSKEEEVATQEDLASLTAFMEAEKPFLNPTLSLRMLANHVAMHPNHLSWLLNQRVGKNFNEYINHRRIEHFKQLVIDPANSHISLIGLAYESGFNSKSVFNTAFKKEVGMTPKAYQKAQMG